MRVVKSRVRASSTGCEEDTRTATGCELRRYKRLFQAELLLLLASLPRTAYAPNTVPLRGGPRVHGAL